MFMFAAYNSHKSRAGFALSAGSNNHYFIILMFVDFFHRDNSALLNFEIAQSFGYLNIVFHRTAVQNYFSAQLFGNSDNFRDARKHGRKCGEYNSALSALEEHL